MKRKLRQYEIYKLTTDRLTEVKGKEIKVLSLDLNKRQALENGEIVKIQSNQLINKILEIFDNQVRISDVIVNVAVPPELKKLGEQQYKALAKNGFILNGNKYVRLYSGSGQIRRNTITFIREDLYEPILNTLLCGLSLSDFGNDFNAAKFNAYSGLNMSGCHLLSFELAPNVCVVDDYEAIRPHNVVNHVTEEEVNYIALPDEDYVLRDGDNDYLIVDDKAIRKSDNVEFSIRTGIMKHIESLPYDEIIGSPELNSFDGQGLMSPEWAQKISEYLGYDYIPSELIIRAPWVKGLLATVPFKEYFNQRGITEVIDAFGVVRQVKDIDVFLSKSQFKMHKIYKKKCEGTGISAWDYYIEAMQNNKLRWGVVKPNSKKEDYEKALNYQYLQALQLDNENVENLCTRTREFLEKLNSGNIEEIYDNLIVNNKGFLDDSLNNEDCDYKKFFQKVIECNPNLINDKYIRGLIYRECETKLNNAKLGKILVRGNFQFCVSDPLAQLQWIEKRHCDSDIEVVGVVPAGYVYSNYWLNSEDATEEIILMRSPLIDRNEISKRVLVQESQSLFRYLESGIVISIHDLTALAGGGFDYDGDILFSTNDKIISTGCYDYATAKPLYYELGSTDLVGAITQDNIIEADIRGLNSKVGTISNKAGSLYAMLTDYEPDSKNYKLIYDNIISLGQVVGMEIDRIKTAVSPTFPLTWNALQAKSIQKRDFTSEQTESQEELKGIYRHNELVPDIKPYYFRYNYLYLDYAIRQLDKAFNKVSVMTHGIKINELIKLCEGNEASPEMVQLYKQYKKAYPVLDTDCVVNHVCHYFEDFEKTLRKQSQSEGTNMLKDFQSDAKLDMEILEQVKTCLDGYSRFKRILTKKNNCNVVDSGRKVKESTANVLDMMKAYYKEEILKITGDNMQNAFDYIVCASKSESQVWEILDTDILQVIRR